MSENEEGGRQEGPAQSDKNTGSAQPGTYGEMEQSGKKTQKPGEKNQPETGDSESEMDQARKGGQQGGNIRQ